MEHNSKTHDELILEIRNLQKELDSLKLLPKNDSSAKELGIVLLGQPEETIRDNSSILELAVDSVDMAWWNMDVLTGNVLFHKRKTDMLGYEAEKFTHYRDFMALIHPDDYETAMQAMRDHFTGKAKTYETEYRILTSKEEYKWFYDIGTIVKRDPSGAPLKVVGFVMDITKRKLSELEIIQKNKELKRADEEKDKFFSIIAHDLRGPMGALVSLSQLMADEWTEISEDDKSAFVANLASSARNSYNLLESLLEWSQMIRGSISFQPQMLVLKDEIQESVTPVFEVARLKNIIILLDIPSGYTLFADKHMLQTIIRNLTSNAVKFTHPGGNVTIAAGFDGKKSTAISVTDSGIGMTRDMVDNLFRMDVVTKRPGTNGEESTGLGLLLCKEFVKRHGGEFCVDSEVNKGSVFSFTIPLTDAN